MKVSSATDLSYPELTDQLGAAFAARAAEHDQSGSFVYKNYEELKEHRYFSLLIPEELGGGGLPYPAVCNIIRQIAHYCGSTALAFSMHQHLIAASVWKYKHKGLGGPMLSRVANEQLVLVSTGARDWLGSNGELTKTEGGYLLSAKKHFASQSVVGDVAVTSAPYLNEDGEWQVLHFPVPLKSEGVHLINDWDVLGMRATGSQSIICEEVFIPEDAIALSRPRDEFHPVWNMVLTVAMPLIMSAYVGIAERAMELALEIGKKYERNQAQLPVLIGQLNNRLLSAQTQWQAMYTLTNNFDFSLEAPHYLTMLSLKTNVAEAAIQTVGEAMQAIGGQSFYKKNELERLFRDIQAAQFHPLPKWEQYAFTGKRLLAK